jgi:hypothetical protein
VDIPYDARNIRQFRSDYRICGTSEAKTIRDNALDGEWAALFADAIQ